MENLNNQNNENIESEKSTGTESDIVQSDNENNSVGEITLDQFKNALENNLDIKGYFDSITDKTVSKRLDKNIESWKEKNLENIINEEINKKYPQKTEAEIKFEEQQELLAKSIAEKEQLQLQIRYQNIMAESNLPMEMLEFVAGKDIETTILNIEKFKNATESHAHKLAQEEIDIRLKASAYTPPSGNKSTSSGSMWD